MTARYSIQVDQAMLQNAVELLEHVGGNSADALRIAINKAAPKIKTASSRAIRDQVRLSASYVGERLTVRKATRARLSGAITVPSRGLLLSRFSTDANIAGDKVSWLKPPLVPKTGIKVKVKPSGAPKLAPFIGKNKPFYLLLNSRQNVGIAAREGSSRKIKVFSGPSLSQVFNTVRDDVMPLATAELQAQMFDAIRYLVAKQTLPEAP